MLNDAKQFIDNVINEAAYDDENITVVITRSQMGDIVFLKADITYPSGKTETISSNARDAQSPLGEDLCMKLANEIDFNK